MALNGFTYSSSDNGNQSLALVSVPKSGSGTALAKGDVLDVDRSNGVVARATSSSTTLTVRAICMETRVAGDTSVVVALINPSQIWRAKCTNNSAANQIFRRNALTDHSALANSTTDKTDTTSVFEVLAPIGAAGDKEVLGRFLVPGIVTA